MPQRKIDVLFWGYIASVLQSLLKPYISGSTLVLTVEDQEILEQSKKFLDSILKGCDTIDSPGALSFKYTHPEVPSATALNLAIDIFSTMSIALPDTLQELKDKLSNYRNILEKLKTSQPIANSELAIAQEVSSFFKALGNKADQESYKSAYSL